MSLVTPIPSFAVPHLPIRRFTVAEYHRMIDAGILTEDDKVELLEGWIVAKMTRKPPHDVAIELLREALGTLHPAGWSLRGQSALTTADSVPEPDMVIVRGKARKYKSRHPEAADTGIVIEVADSTLTYDRKDKGRIYARAGIPIYWIVNLVDEQIEVYSEPDGTDGAYRQRQDYAPAQEVPLLLDGQIVGMLLVAELLP